MKGFQKAIGLAALLVTQACDGTEHLKRVSTDYVSDAVIDAKNVPLEAALDDNPATLYVLDGSTSMEQAVADGRSRFAVLQQYAYPADSRVYVFSSTASHNGANIHQVNPAGDTPLKKSVYEAITQLANPNELGLVQSDGDDTQGGPNVEESIAAANKKHLCINTIALGQESAYLKRLAEGTGCKYTYVP